MFLSRMKLDVSKRQTMFALNNPNIFHGIVEDSFPVRQRNLWRLDILKGQYFLLILSPEKPDLSKAADQFGFPYDAVPWETKDYQSLLNRITSHSKWNFRLTANPTICQKGMINAHTTPKFQKKWLMDRAEKHGFSLDENDFEVMKSQWYSFKRNSKEVTLLGVTFEGILQVTNCDAFKEVLISGLGREKAYGMGLLTIVSCS